MAEQIDNSSVTRESGAEPSAHALLPRLTEFAVRIRLELVCFPLVLTAYLLHLFLSGYDRFYYDAAAYWELGRRFEHNGHFSLLAYHDGGFYPRGYSVPLLNHTLQVIASAGGVGDVTIVKLWGALLASTLGVVVLPRLGRQLFPDASIGVGRVLALNALIFLYWRDHFDFPLSDFPALLAAAIGVLGLLRGGAFGYLVAGLGLGLAENMRPAYAPALVACVAAAAVLPLRSWSWGPRAAAAALVLAGAFVAVLPQMTINYHQRGSWSPSVARGKDLSILQLSDGMIAQKRETYVGSAAGYPEPRVFYLDPATQHVLRQEHISTTSKVLFAQYVAITSYGQYARVVYHHPVEIAASYLRHIFNGLDVRYPTPYIRNLGDTSIVLSLLQYTLIFVALARLLLPDARRALGGIRWVGIVVLLAACLTALPGAVESRFFLPLQALIYMLVCFGPAGRATLIGGSSHRRAGLVVAYVAFVLVCLALSSATLAQLQHPGPTLGLGTGERLAAPPESSTPLNLAGD